MIEQAGGRGLISACRMVEADWGNMSVFLSPPDCVLCDGWGSVCRSPLARRSLRLVRFSLAVFLSKKRANGKHKYAATRALPFDDSVNSANLGGAVNLPRPKRNRRIGLSFPRLSFDV